MLAPTLLMCRPFCMFERCLDSNPESCLTKQARYQLSHPSPMISHPSPLRASVDTEDTGLIDAKEYLSDPENLSNVSEN